MYVKIIRLTSEPLRITWDDCRYQENLSKENPAFVITTPQIYTVSLE